MSFENIRYEVKEQIAWITINRPDSLNSLNPDVLKEIHNAVDLSEHNEAVAVIVLTGAGRAFCAGVDLKSLQGLEGGDVGADLNHVARETQNRIETASKVVIAMVNGFCLTGGLELALACDLIITADEAKFGDTHVRWGIRCTWGMSQRLSQRVGELKAREMTYTADMISGTEAERIGLVNQSVPASKLEAAVREMADKIKKNSLGAIAAHKYLYTQSKKEQMAKGLEREYTTRPNISDTAERLTGFIK
ncbi:MAG: enoyl-CoA hydratase/isomerase family protein [bacterium]